jgi:hypothetical protein
MTYKGLTLFEEFKDGLPHYTLEVPPCNDGMSPEQILKLIRDERRQATQRV